MKKLMHKLCIINSVSVYKLTVIIRSQVHRARMVVGRASTRCWGNSEHIREVLLESGEQEDIVCCGMLDGLIDSWSPLV